MKRFSPSGVARNNSSPRSPRKSADPSRPRPSLVRLLIALYESRSGSACVELYGSLTEELLVVAPLVAGSAVAA